MDARTAAAELVCRTCLALDQKDFPGYLALCDETFHYEITTYSPEIRKPMTWLALDRESLQTLFTNLPRHNSDASLLTRHVAVYTVTFAADLLSAEVVSAVQVFRTTLDGGATALFAVGKFYDTVRFDGDGDGVTALLRRREVRLDTRMLGYGHHIPF